MTLTLDSVKTWVMENPMKAAGIGIAAAATITLLVSPKARKAVGLGKAPVTKKGKKVKKTKKEVKRLQ